MIQVAQRSGKMYFKYLRVILPKLGKTELKEVSLPLPSKQLLIDYELKKNAFTQYLNEEIEEKMKKDNKEEKLTKDQEKFETIRRLRAINQNDNSKWQWEDIGDIFNTKGNAIRKWYSETDRRTNREV